MEFGQIPQLQEFQASTIRNLEVVKESNPTNAIKSEKEPKEIMEVLQEEAQNVSKPKEVKVGDLSTYNQVAITNLSFGFNNESKDFYIKVKRGDFEAQYPTDEMMKLKALQMQANENALEENQVS